MDRAIFSTIAHADHLFFSPLSEQRAEQLLSLLEPAPSLPVLDIGCGQGELLIRVCERFNAVGIGVDTNPVFVERAQLRAKGRVAPERITFVAQAAGELALAPGSLAGVLCIGSSQAYGSYEQTLSAAASLVTAGGFALIGEPFWRKRPARQYLHRLGATGDEHRSHSATARLGSTLGWTLLYTAVSSEDEWDHYEGLYWRAVERFVHRHPEYPDAAAMVQRVGTMRDLYLDAGRETMGFGWYLYLRP